MIYCIDPLVDEPIMLLNKHIGFDDVEGQGVDGSLFQQELLQLDALGKKRIQVWINSAGGVVMDGYNIYNAILKSKTKVDTYCVGIAASIAAVIFQAGRNRIMADYSLLMYHNPYGGNDDEQLNKMKESLSKMISERTGKTEAEVLSIMDKTTWISASEAFSTGFCDTIEVSADQNKKRISEPKALWRESNLVLNSLFNNKKNNQKMIKVTNKLGLNAEANEEAVVAAITSIENKKAEMEDKMAKMEEKLAKMEDECNEFKSKVAEFKKKAEDEAKAKAEMEEKMEDEKAKNMIEVYVKQGRIKIDQINIWAQTAKTIGFEQTKNMIEALPNHKSATKIDVSSVSNEAALTNVIAGAMASIREQNKI